MVVAFACGSAGDVTQVLPKGVTALPQIVSIDSLSLKPDLGVVIYRGQTFTGTGLERYPNDVIAAETNYVDGKKHGRATKYFEDGSLSYEAHYAMGKLDSISKSWWRNGHRRSEANFVAGVAEGLQREWYTSGAPFKSLNLLAGREEGLQQSWRENGKLYSNYVARDNRIYGLKRANLCFSLEDQIVQYD